MRGCVSGMTAQLLVGLHRIGLVGLREALKEAHTSGLVEREEIVDYLIEKLSPANYMPSAESESYRQALWREFKRYRGEDISDFYSEVEVVVRGEPGEKLDKFLQTMVAVFAEYELKPVVSFEPPAEKGPHPQLVLGDEPVVKGIVPKLAFKHSVRKVITDW